MLAMGSVPLQLLFSPIRIWGETQSLDAVPYPCRRRNRFVGKASARLDVFESLKSEILNDPVFEWNHSSRQWLEQMIDYNVSRGKFLRSLSLMDCYKSLKEGEDLSEDQLFLASVLGWCIEWFQASLLIHDDIMDNSETRRGEACWYRVPKVPRILKKHFGQEPYYMDLLNLFNEVEYQSVLGQMMDVITTVEEERDLLKYSWTLHRLITQNKTSCYSFYLPVACALLLAGENLDDHVNLKDVLFDMGNFFQALDDYQDCYGDPKLSGKIGTDIEDGKCSWLVLKAMELCSEEQKKILLEHYGKADPEDVATVKGIYNDVDLQSVCKTCLREDHDRLRSRVEAHPSKAVQSIWATYIKGVMKTTSKIL